MNHLKRFLDWLLNHCEFCGKIKRIESQDGFDCYVCDACEMSRPIDKPTITRRANARPA